MIVSSRITYLSCILIMVSYASFSCRLCASSSSESLLRVSKRLRAESWVARSTIISSRSGGAISNCNDQNSQKNRPNGYSRVRNSLDSEIVIFETEYYKILLILRTNTFKMSPITWNSIQDHRRSRPLNFCLLSKSQLHCPMSFWPYCKCEFDRQMDKSVISLVLTEVQLRHSEKWVIWTK